MKALLRTFVLVVGLGSVLAPPAAASTVYWDSGVNVPGWGYYSLCETFPGACGYAFIAPPTTCENVSWWQLVPSEFLGALQYIANMLGGEIHFQGGCEE